MVDLRFIGGDVHKYMADDRELASVTTILREVGMYKDLEFLDPKYRQRGEAVHKACRVLDSSTHSLGAIHPEIVPYLQQYEEWKRISGFVPRVWEVGLASLKHGHAGTLDLGGDAPNGEIWLIDLKSGHVPKFVGSQVAAYEDLLLNGEVIPDEANDMEWLRFVRLSKKPIRRKSLQVIAEPGPGRLRSHDEPRWMLWWKAALTVYQARREHGML